MRIDVGIVDTVPLGVDTPADLETRPRAYWRRPERLLQGARKTS